MDLDLNNPEGPRGAGGGHGFSQLGCEQLSISYQAFVVWIHVLKCGLRRRWNWGIKRKALIQ